MRVGQLWWESAPKREYPAADFEAAMCHILQGFGLTPESVRAVATLERGATEEGFGVWAMQHGWPVLTYTAEQLATIQEMPNPSAIAPP